MTNEIRRANQSKSGSPTRVELKADPVLKKLLDNHALENKTVEVAVSLRRPAKNGFLTPDQTAAITSELIRQVCHEVGGEPRQVNVFKNIGSFALTASVIFIRALLAHDEVEHAMANRQPDEFDLT